METRPYFLFGDLLATGLAGAVCGLAGAAVVVPGWNMFLAMIPAMVVGMAVSLPISIGLGALFGAMEIMVPTMFGGMMAGMWVGMAEAMGRVETVGDALGQGALVGWACWAVTWVLNGIIQARGAQHG